MLICRIRFTNLAVESVAGPRRGEISGASRLGNRPGTSAIRVSGLTIGIAFRMEAKSRYSLTNNSRSEFVSRNRLGSLNEDIKLLTEHQILGVEPGARFEPQAQRIRQLFQPLKHRAAKYPILGGLSLGSNLR